MTGRRSLRLFFIILLFLSIRVSAALPAPARRARIAIPETVHLEGAAFTLGDVAEIDAPANVRASLGALILSVSNGSFTREAVLQAIGSSGLDDLRVEVRMPARVRVLPPGASPEEAAPPLSDASLVSVIKSLASWEGEVEAAYSGKIPPGRLVEPASIVPGSPSATLRFQDGAGRVRSLAVRLAWRQNVLVAARSIQRGLPIRAEDLMVRSMKIARPGVYAADTGSVVGRVLRKPLLQGEPVPLELLTDPVLVRRGRAVQIVARHGGLTASAKGVLLDDGSPGDLVRVRRTDNRKTVLKAYILDENTVEVKVQ